MMRRFALCCCVAFAAVPSFAQRPERVGGDAASDEADFRARFEKRLDEELSRVRERLREEFGERRSVGAGRASAVRTEVLERRVAELSAENAALRAEIDALKRRSNVFYVCEDPVDGSNPGDEASERISALRRSLEDLRRRGAPAEDLEAIRAELDAMEPGGERAVRGGGPDATRGRARFLGVVPGVVSADWRKKHQVDRGVGARVMQVVEGSAAAKLGFKPDDVVVELNGAAVKGPDDLARRIAAAPVESRIRWIRGDESMSAAVRLGESPAAEPPPKGSEGGGGDGKSPEDALFQRLYEGALRRVIAADQAVESRPEPGAPPR
jgi:hypothetical protein